MRRSLLLCCLAAALFVWGTPAVSRAQAEGDKPAEEPEAQEPQDAGDGDATPAEEAPATEVSADSAAVAQASTEAADEPEVAKEPKPAKKKAKKPKAKKKAKKKGKAKKKAAAQAEPELPDPAAAADRLAEVEPEDEGGEGGGMWTAPETVFTLHGYLRARGSLKSRMWLGRDSADNRSPVFNAAGEQTRANYDPFDLFKPSTNLPDAPAPTEGVSTTEPGRVFPVEGACDDGPATGDTDTVGACSRQRTVSANLRLRLKPELHVSDDVRVKAWIDVLDNYSFGTGGADGLDLTQALKVRRAWGEVRNRDLGELRFGRMGADWGLGLLDNGGDRDGIDSDFSKEVDRVMAVGNLAGFYLMAAWDWDAEGTSVPSGLSPSGVPIDDNQEDDVDQWTFAVGRRKAEDAQERALRRGELVFNFGLFFRYRDRFLVEREPDPLGAMETDAPATTFRRLNETQYIPDLWIQVLYEGLRLELEAVYVAGTREGACPSFNGTDPKTATENGVGTTAECRFNQLGAAVELEYRLLDERLGLHFHSGVASGDKQAYGLAATNDSNYQRQGEGGGEISTFAFHPDYRVDLILWRTIMRQVKGAYYVRPGLSYDFIRDSYGERLGGRVDVIYSRAWAADQTWGENANLGLELDASLYYRSEDGPDPMDGFYGLVQFGVLFPFSGLGTPDDGPENALILRGALGVAF